MLSLSDVRAKGTKPLRDGSATCAGPVGTGMAASFAETDFLRPPTHLVRVLRAVVARASKQDGRIFIIPSLSVHAIGRSVMPRSCEVDGGPPEESDRRRRNRTVASSEMAGSSLSPRVQYLHRSSRCERTRRRASGVGITGCTSISYVGRALTG